MKTMFCFLPVFVAFVSQSSLALAKAVPPPSEHASLADVFSEFHVVDKKSPEIATEVITEDGSCSPYYYVELRFPGIYNGKPYRIELDFQTITNVNMERIASAIEANYPTRGLPNCMKADTYSTDIWTTDEVSKIVLIPATFRSAPQSCFAFLLPYTKCVDVENLYP